VTFPPRADAGYPHAALFMPMAAPVEPMKLGYAALFKGFSKPAPGAHGFIRFGYRRRHGGRSAAI
jgi:hypothetical protein